MLDASLQVTPFIVMIKIVLRVSVKIAKLYRPNMQERNCEHIEKHNLKCSDTDEYMNISW